METTNNRGQILIEVSLVMFFIALALFVAVSEITNLKETQSRYYLTQDNENAFKDFRKNKK